jgi:hypothetical protein
MSGYYDRRDERSRVSEGLNHLYEWFCVNSEEELGRLIYHFPNYRFSSQEMSFIIDEYRKQRSSAFKAFLEFIRYRDERDIDYVTNETLVRFTKEEVFPRMIRMFQDATRPRRDEPYLRGNYGRSPDPYPRTSFSTNQFDVSESTRGMDAFFRNNRPSSNIRDNVYEATRYFATPNNNGQPQQVQQPQAQQTQQQAPQPMEPYRKPVQTNEKFAVVTNEQTGTKMNDKLEFTDVTTETKLDDNICCLYKESILANKLMSISVMYTELVPPFNTRHDAVQFVSGLIPGFTTASTYCHLIDCKVVKAIKINTSEDLNATRKQFETLSNVVLELKSIKDFNALFVPEFNKLSDAVKEHFQNILFKELNHILRMHLFRPDNPLVYPKITKWEHIGKMLSPSASDSGYIRYMNDKYSRNFEQNVFQCTHATLKNILCPAGHPGIVDSSELGTIAIIPNLPVIVDGKLPREYGLLNEENLLKMKQEIDSKYLIRLQNYKIILTNITSANCTIHKDVNLIAEDCHPIHSCISSLFDVDATLFPNNVTLVIEKGDNEPSLRYQVGKNIEGNTLITRIGK